MAAGVKTLLLATRNRHKAQEIRAILGGSLRYLTLLDLEGAPEPVEDAATFAGNALKKAEALACWWTAERGGAGHVAGGTFFVLADDSGLEVDALGGAPGVFSARFAALETGAAGNSPDAANNARLLRLLRDVPAAKRTARFRCALAWLTWDAVGGVWARAVFEGACEGRILSGPSGPGGFGYDPLFVPDGFEKSFAELGDEVKNSLSHRGQALGKLRKHLGGAGMH